MCDTNELDFEVPAEIESSTNLSFDDIQINLRLLCDIKENEKLMIDDKYITIDQRILQSIRRQMSADSRTKTLAFIDNIINDTQHFCMKLLHKNHMCQKEDNEKLTQIQTLLNGSLIGLSRLALTYASDKLSRAKIETIQSNIRTFCDLYLKLPVQPK